MDISFIILTNRIDNKWELTFMAKLLATVGVKNVTNIEQRITDRKQIRTEDKEAEKAETGSKLLAFLSNSEYVLNQFSINALPVHLVLYFRHISIERAVRFCFHVYSSVLLIFLVYLVGC